MELLLWEFSVRATLMAVATGTVLWGLRIKTAATRHSAWAGFMLVMLLLPLWTAWGPKAPVRLLPPLAEKSESPAFLPGSLSWTTSSNVGPHGGTGTSLGKNGLWQNGRAVILGIYVLGLCSLLGRLLVGTVRARTLALRAIDEGDGRLTHVSCTAPITVGWLQPKVILPSYWRQWPAAQLDAVLIHEGEHVRRRDPLVQWLSLLNRAIFWFHPLAWWLERHLSALAEEACDAAVLESGHNARDYSEYLLDIARSVMRAGARLHATGAAMPGSFLNARLRKIMEGPLAPKISRGRAIGAATACVFTTALFAAGTLDHPLKPAVENHASQVQPSRPLLVQQMEILGDKRPRTLFAQAAPNAPRPRSQPDPYTKWLEEEAVYIITAEERSTFLGLGTDQERQQFIAQFWARRDPGGGPPNAYREEHYRRIAFANDHFGFADVAGWRTDRGRIYIKYGPPETLDAGPRGGVPSEIWFYRLMDGVGINVSVQFLDEARNGQFSMTQDPAGTSTTTEEQERQKLDQAIRRLEQLHVKTYVIRPEDVLFISVWREDSLSRQYSVRTDGMITLPLIGDVQAAGLTPDRLRDQLTLALGRYVAQPEVNVMVMHMNSNRALR